MPFLPNPRTREEAIAGMKQDRENHTVDHPGSTISVHTTSYIRSMLYKVPIEIASPTGMIWGLPSTRPN
jgi:hypothetical protein